MNKERLQKIGMFCKQYREQMLKTSLTDFCEQTQSNLKNVSAFEHGKANNIMYLKLYYEKAPTNECRKEFAIKFFELIKEV